MKFYINQKSSLSLHIVLVFPLLSTFAWNFKGFLPTALGFLSPKELQSFSPTWTSSLLSKHRRYSSSVQGESDLGGSDFNNSIEARAIFCAEHLGKCSREEVDRLTDALREKREVAHLEEGQRSISADDVHWKLLEDQLRKLNNDSEEYEIPLVDELVSMLKDDYKEMIKEDHLHVIDIKEEEKNHREEAHEEELTNLDIILPEG
jgi:hypothetical protein